MPGMIVRLPYPILLSDCPPFAIPPRVFDQFESQFKKRKGGEKRASCGKRGSRDDVNIFSDSCKVKLEGNAIFQI